MSRTSIPVDQVQELWQAHDLGLISRLSPIPTGNRNQAFYVNHDQVLRINTMDPHLPKFRNEKAALDLLTGSGMPIPEVIFLDESQEIIPYDLIALKRLPGISIAESPDLLTHEELTRLAYESGRMLARLHQQTFEAFGDICDLNNKPFQTWLAFYLDYAEHYLSEANRMQLVDSAVIGQLEGVLHQAGPLLDEVQEGVFVHSDYHYENILQQDGHLTGLLDFEWSYSGDPASDFVPVPERQRVLPGSEVYFLRGYLTEGTLDDGYTRRVQLYQLFLELEESVTCQRLENPAGATKALRKMEKRLSSWSHGPHR